MSDFQWAESVENINLYTEHSYNERRIKLVHSCTLINISVSQILVLGLFLYLQSITFLVSITWNTFLVLGEVLTCFHLQGWLF